MLSGRVQARFAVIVRDAPARPDGPARPLARIATPVGAVADGLEGLLAAARDVEASDLHVVAGRPVLMRVAGELTPRGAPIHDVAVEKMLAGIVPERLKATLAEQGSCDFAMDRGVVVVSSKESIARTRVTRTYDLAGLPKPVSCI